MLLDIDQVRIDVALGRRVMVLGDLLLPPEPSPSSLATCRDIAQTLDEWQGPGLVVICGQLVTATNGVTQGSAAAALQAHVALTDAFAAFAARPDSRVIIVVGMATPCGDLVALLGRVGVSL